MNNMWLIAIGAAAVLLAAILLIPGTQGDGDAVDVAASSDARNAETSDAGPSDTSDANVFSALSNDETAVAIDGVIAAGEYAHNVDAEGFQVHWRNDAEVLWVAMVSPGTGYAAVGFDPESRMKGANMILGAVVDGEAVWRDDYGIGALSHTDDVSRGGTDDVIAAAGREHNGYTIFEFSIPLDSGDTYDKLLEPGGTYTIIVAYNAANDSFNVRHTQRGSGEIQLDSIP